MADDPRLPRDHSHTVPSAVAFRQHPVHPMLVVYPIAFLSTMVVTDAVFLWRAEPFWALLSFWLNVAGFAVGVVAGLVGTADLLLLREVRRRVSAWSHFIAAVMVLALAGAGLWLRGPDPVAAVWPWGLLLSALTFALVMVAGWLGGTLSFRHGIGVYGDRDDERAGPADDATPPA
jgi:uncharacterized membrane protein